MLQKPNTTNEKNASRQEAILSAPLPPGVLPPSVLPLGTAQHAEVRRWLRWLNQALSLPNDWVSFTLFTLVLAVLSGGLILHIHLSAQIYKTQLEIDQLEMAYNEIAHQNTEIIWQISQFTSLNTLYRRAEAMGYIPATQQYYVAETDVPTLGGIDTLAPQAAFAGAMPSVQNAPMSGAAETTVAFLTDSRVDQTTLGAHELLMSSSHAPAWSVRMQQRMARVGSWMQAWWQ